MASVETTQAIDPIRFREVLGHYPTGVTLITAVADDGEATGMVVGSFTSVSLDPPLVAFLPTKTSFTFERLRTADAFTVNILAHDQEELCRRLARPGRDKLAGISWYPSSNGSPVLDGVVASIDCSFHSVLDGGDHHIVLGTVRNLDVRRAVAPLLFFQGAYGGFTPGSFMTPTDHELAEGVTLAQKTRTQMEALAEETGAEVTAFTRIADDVAVVATTASGTRDSTAVLGARYPLMPPLGELFVAWENKTEVDSWLARAYGADKETLHVFESRLAAARERGWSFSLSNHFRETELQSALRDYGVGEVTPAHQRAVNQTILKAAGCYKIHNLLPGHVYDIASLVAPVRDSHNKVKLVLRLSRLPHRATTEQINEWASRLTRAANKAAAQISGSA